MERSFCRRGISCHFLGWWLLLLAISIAGSTAETTNPSIVAWATTTGGALHIRWTISPTWTSNNSVDNVQDFHVFVNGQDSAIVDTDTNRYDVYGVTNNTAYSFQVNATLVQGSSVDPLYSDAISVTTLDRSIPDIPGTPTLLAITGGFVQVIVQPPADTGGADLVNVTITVRRADNFYVVAHQSQSPQNSDLLTYSVHGLDALTNYWISAIAVSEGGLTSLESAPLVVRTMAIQLPGPCPPPKILATTGASVVLQLIPPLDDGGDRIQGYNIYMAMDAAGDFEEVASTIGTVTVDVAEILRSSDDEPLLPETRYFFKADAINLVDICISVATSLQLANATDALTTSASVPGAPPSPCFLSATGGSITMSLMKPANMQGANCTGFLITIEDGNGNTATNSIDADDDATYEATSLQANSSYTISAAVITNLGTSPYSALTVMNTTTPTSPTMPLGITVTNVTGSSALAEWSVPLDNGGVDITGYTIIVMALGGQEERPALSSPTILTHLVARMLYTVKAVATNSAGKTSPLSVGATFKTKSPTVPSEPWGLSLVSASGGDIEVAWNPPDDRGGEILSMMGYNVVIYSATSCFDSEASSSCSGCNSVLLSAGQYELITNSSECEVPTTKCSDGTLDCCLTNEDSTYGVGFSCGNMATASVPRSVVGSTSVVFNGLNYSSTYYFGVQALNRAGKSATSNLQGLQTTSQTSPSYPTNVRQLTATGGSIQLTWDAPLNTGGGPILGYHVYRNYQLISPGYVMPPYSDCGGMVAQTTYLYGIAAVNASLVEGAMATTKLTTESFSRPLKPSMSLISRMNDQLHLSATAPCDVGGDKARSYQYTINIGEELITSEFFECCDFVVQNLQPNQSYDIAVSVDNLLSWSPWVEQNFTTTSGVPSTPVASLLYVNTYSAVVALGSPPYDKETRSYDVYVYQGDTQIVSQHVTCQEDVDPGQYACPTSYRMDGLDPEIEYGIRVLATGPLGSSVSDLVQFTTSPIAIGTFGMSTSDYYADEDGNINTVLLRSGGTSGSVDVIVDVMEPNTVLVRCDWVGSGSCYCVIFLTSSGAVPEACSILFLDGQESAHISFSMWNDDSAELLPSPVVVAPVGVPLSSQSAALLHIDTQELPGFVSFSMGLLKVMENSQFAMVDVVRVNGTTGTISFDFETFDMSALAGDDYILTKGTATLSDQQSGTQIWIQLINNNVMSPDKMFGLRLANQTTQTGDGILVTLQVIIQDDDLFLNAIPSKMDPATIVYTTGGEFEIQWPMYSHDSASVSGYMVRVTSASGGNFYNLYNTTLTTLTLSGLTARSTYRVQISAWNAFGVGEYSDGIDVVTTDITVPGPPLVLTATDVTYTNVTLTWEPPRDDGGSAIVGYHVLVEDKDGNYVEQGSVNASNLLFVADNLMASSEYVCYAFTYTTGFATISDAMSPAQISVVTASGVAPGPPPAVTLVGQPNGGTLIFSMTQPQDTGGMPLTNASLYLREATVDELGTTDAFAAVCQINLTDQTDDTCTVSNLLASTSYEVYATFSNEMGESAPAASEVFQTSSVVDLPSPPLNFRATDVTGGNIRLEWDVPADLSGASGVVGYIVYQKYDVLGTSYFTYYDGQDSIEQSMVARGLTRNSTYAFAVVALTDASFCANPDLYNLSPFLSVTTLLYSRLSSPVDLHLVSRTGGEVTLGWNAPGDLAGVPLQYYEVELVLSSNDFEMLSDSLSSDNTTFAHYGLSEGTSYSYVVTAVNQDGPSERSAVFTVTTASVSQPGDVQNFRSIDAAATGGSVTLAWDPPQDTGGRQINVYEISRTGYSGSFSISTTTFEDRSGLDALTGYTYTITPFNGLYRGYVTAIVAETGPPSLPDPPQLNMIPYGGRLEVSWLEPVYTGGILLNSYVITLSGSDGTVINSSTTGDLSCTFGNLSASTWYILSGSSLNDIGNSSSLEYNVETSPPDAPGAPPQPTATNIRGGSLDIHVESPDYTGGEDVTLTLYMNIDKVHVFAEDERDTTIYGLIAETEYSFSVSAANTVSETRSVLVKVTTTAISTPGQIQNLQQVSVSFNQMVLSWDNVQDTGGDADLQYEVTYFQCSSDGIQQEAEQTQMSDTATALIEGLQYSTFYSVAVMAVSTTSLVGNASSTIIIETEQPFSGVIVADSAEVFVREDAGVVSIPIDRVNGSYGNVSYTFETSDESALFGVNYQYTTGTRTLTTNVDSDSFDIPIVNDAVYDPNISFLVTITDSNTALESTTRVILEDDGDAGTISFAQSSLALLENSGVAYLDMTRTGGTSPQADIKLKVVQNASSVDRFHLLNSTVTFDEGETLKTISIEIIDDSAYQFVPDSMTIGFDIIDGGVLYGSINTSTITALDNGDISPPKQCLNLRQTSATGGTLGLAWTQPIDHGEADVTLTFLASVLTGTNVVITQSSPTETTIIYGLNQSTTYLVSVQAVNSAGTGIASTPLLLSTPAATPPTAPLNIQTLSVSSSSVLLSWDAPLDVGGSPIIAYTIYNVSTTTSTQSLFPSVSCSAPRVCSIMQLLALTSYNIQIQASSAFVTQGSLSDIITFTTLNPDYPDTPPIAVVLWISAGAMTIQMFDPVNVGGSNIQQYKLYMRANDEVDFPLVYNGTSMEYTVYHLRYQTIYLFKYQAVNSVGPSPCSPIKTIQTLSKSLPSAPLNVGVTDKTGGAITLTWDEPLDVGGRNVTGYLVQIVSINDDVASVVGYNGEDIPAREGTVYGLTANTSYGMQVVAYLEVSNCFDSSLQSWSSVTNVSTTMATPPLSAPALFVNDKSGGTIKLEWSAPEDQGGVPLTGYTLYSVDSAGVSSVLFSTAEVTVLSFLYNDLTADTNYSFTISTANSAGSSPTSSVLEETTDSVSPPSAPLNIQQLLYNTGGAITIGWDRSVDTGGQPIAGYTVYRNGAVASGTLSPDTRNFTDKDELAASTRYQFTVRAIGQNGMISVASAECSASTTEATKPQKAQSITAVLGSSYLNVSWILDADSGGLPITSYEVSLMLGFTMVKISTVTTPYFVFKGLTASTVYTGSVTVYNGVGASDEVTASLATRAMTVPSSPDTPLVLAVFGGNFTIQVTPPEYTGGSNITAMKVYESTLGTVATLTLTAMAPVIYTLFGVSATTDYFVTCSAVNAAGEGPQSNRLAVRTATLSPPGEFSTAPLLVVAAGTALTFAWDLPADTGGSLSLTYEIRVSNSTMSTINPTVSLSYTAMQLAFNSPYHVSVRAVNNVGPGLWSPILTATTLPDADGEFNFAQANVSVLENATQVSLVVQRTTGLSGQIMLTYTTEPTGIAPATIGSNYAVVQGSTTTTGTVVFEPQQTQNSIVIFIINDSIYEYPFQTFAVRITAATSPSGGAPIVGSNNLVVVTILDDGDAGFLSFESPAYSFLENAQTASVTIIREYGKSTSISLGFKFGGGTATPDVNYRESTTPIVMGDGVTKATLTFAIINDNIYEYPDEYFFIWMTVLSGGAILRQPQTCVTILDDGDVSNPGTCPPPVLVSVTGGAATFATHLPNHNGSATGVLLNYTMRLTTDMSSTDFTQPVGSMFFIGNLTALTTYNVTIAASNIIGLGPFSNDTQFSTTAPTLPSAVASISVESRTGGRISLAWSTPDDTGGVPISKYRVYIVDVPLRLGIENLHPIARATVYGLTASTTYAFLVQAGNDVSDNDGWGNLSAPFNSSTTAVTQPGPVITSPDPYKPATGGRVYLSWNAPLDTGGTNVSSYIVFTRCPSRPWYLSATILPSLNPLSTSVATLNASTAYEFFVLAENSVPPVKLPAKLSIAAGSYVLRSSTDLSSWLSIGSVIAIQDAVFVVNDLSSVASGSIGLKYPHLTSSLLSQTGTVTGQATSFSVLNTSIPTLPDLPPAPILAMSTGGMINATLFSPEDTGGIPILDFSLYWNGIKLNDDTYVKTTSKANYLQISAFVSVSHLKSETSYNVSAVAINSLSLCNFGRVLAGPNGSFQTTIVTVPGPPQLGTYRITGGGITMNIIDPHDTGGNDIQIYRLYYKRNIPTDSWQLSYNGSEHQATVAPLKSATEYTFMSSINNGVFDSMNSSMIVVRTINPSPPGSCDAPTFVNATGGMILVSWTYPADNGGSNVTGFYATIVSSLDGSGKMMVQTNTTSCSFYRLMAESSYDVVVRAGNFFGYGPDSAIATFQTKAASPPAGEIDVTVQLTTGGAAEISFNEPIDLGGATSSDMIYSIYLDHDNTINMSYSALEDLSSTTSGGERRLTENAQRRLQTAMAFTQVLVADLDPETLYGVQVQPTSVYSSGGASASFGIETLPASKPSAPVGLTVVALTGGSVSLSWGASLDSGGIPLNGYSLNMSSISKDGPFTEFYHDMLRATTVYRLQPISTYWAFVTAWNDIGESPLSNVVTFSTPRVTPPSPPQNLTITALGYNSVECSWEVPSDIGGDTIDDYTVTATSTNDPTVSVSFTPQDTSTSLTGLNVSTSYAISVTAQNTLVDSSPASVTRYARTSSGVDTPSTPQIGCVSHDSVELLWYPYPGATAYTIVRDGVDIGTTSDSHFIDQVTLSTASSYAIRTSSGSTPSTAVSVTTVDPSDTITDAICQGNVGHISQLNYTNNVKKRWSIQPMTSYSTITLTFSLFELECDHDSVEILDALTEERLWKGGCVRAGRFVYQAISSVVVIFTSDASVTAAGINVQYEVDGSTEATRIPPPGNGIVCSGHGRSQSDGTCKCNVGFTGEGCNNRIVCCSDPQRCHNAVCDLDPAIVIVVSREFGDDAQGTGQLMNASETGTASKAVKTISRAVELSTTGSVIFVYPGTYSGVLNRDLVVGPQDFTISTLKGPYWTIVDCEMLSRFLFVTSSSVDVEGLTLLHCGEADGGAFKIVGGDFRGTNMLITNANASQNGGALYATSSDVTLHQVEIINSTAGAEGGALYFEDSNASMSDSNVTMCTAARGGAVALRGTSYLSTMDTELNQNVASESGGGAFIDGVISLNNVQLSSNNAPNGGGVAVENGTLTMERCLVSNNSADIAGGGLSLSGTSSMAVIATSIQTNTAGVRGGGVYTTGTIEITFDKLTAPPSLITGNTAASGAGMYVYHAYASFQGIDIEDGLASDFGGGVAMVDSTVEWSDVVIQRNRAQEGGGVVLQNSHLTSKGSVNITTNSAVEGGAVWLNTSTMSGVVDTQCLSNTAKNNGGSIFSTGICTVGNVHQELNSAQNGGCMYVESATLSLVDTEILNCTAGVAGGGIWAEDSQVTMKNVSLQLSTAPDGGGLFAISSFISGNLIIEACSGVNHGGGMYVNGDTTVVGVIVDNCKAQEGGAVCAVDSNLVVENCTLSNSYASEQGGGLSAINSVVLLIQTDIVGDITDEFGGGVYLETSTIIHDDVTVKGCNSSAGGGMYLKESNVTGKTNASSTRISENQAGIGGNMLLSGLCSIKQLVVSSGNATTSAGGIGIDSKSSTTIQTCLVVNNSAVIGGGMALQTDSMCTVIDSVVAMNVANNSGGGIGITDAALSHNNLSVLFNSAQQGGGVFATGVSSIVKLANRSPQALFQNNTVPGSGGGLYVAQSSQINASGVAFLNGSAFQGAGIYVDSAILVLNDALFQNEIASSDGGGIYASSSSELILTNCSFLNNNASSLTGYGGAVRSAGGEIATNIVSMSNCTLTGNTAGIGGGITLDFTAFTGSNTVLKENVGKSGGAVAVLSKGSVVFSNCAFVNNTMPRRVLGVQGGSLYITSGDVTITDSQIVSNEVATLALYGGLIYAESSAYTTVTIVNSLLEYGQAYSGGLIYSTGAVISIRNSTLHRGFGYDFGAGIYAVQTQLSISDSTFFDNFAFYDGGGIYIIDGGQLTVADSFFDLNAVQESGGAIFISPGAAVDCTVSGSNFTRNTNVGLGSTIFIGRQNTAHLSNCNISDNGGSDTEGGALNIIDATVNIEGSLFERNAAAKGAAIQISRTTNLTMTQTIFRNNSASDEGGALHASIRAVATFTDSIVDGNDAGEGGAVYAMGTVVIALTNTDFLNNTASSFGGAISMRGSAVLTVTNGTFKSNEAYTGGGVSLQDNSSFSVANSRFEDNNASDFGAGIYIDKSTEEQYQAVNCKTTLFGGNEAVAGGDIYWVFYPWFNEFDCIECATLIGDEKLLFSSSAMKITPGWWPLTVTSGVSLGINVPTNVSSVSVATSRRLSISYADSEVYLNANLAMPGSSVLWPTVVVRDFYDAIATYDNVTQCQAALKSGEVGDFSFSPATWITVDEGYIVFERAEVFSISRDDPYALYINCTLSPVLQSPITVNVTVDTCNPGYENIQGVCLSCVKGTYSFDGENCYLCPVGASCEEKDSSGVATGVVSPLRQQGYFISKIRSSYAASSCENPDTWPPDDPCKSIDITNLTKRIHECFNKNPQTFYDYWSRDRVFSCLSGNEYYSCDTNAACVEATTPSVSNGSTISVSTASVQPSGQCAIGYSGIFCAVCDDGYYKSSSGSCKQCSDPKDPTVERTTRMLALLPIIVAIAALVILFYLFSNASEHRVISHAQAAKRFQVYEGQSRAQKLLLSTKAKIHTRVSSMMKNAATVAHSVREKLGKKHKRYPFNVAPRPVEGLPAWRPEKFKIMLGYFQVIGSFKNVYEIPWPNSMGHLMDICSLADFNFVDTTAAECLLKRDYFTNYRYALFTLLGMLFLIFLTTVWGVLRYRVKLSTLPRHCVSCGLPVFTLEHRSPEVQLRRATLLATLKLEQQTKAIEDAEARRASLLAKKTMLEQEKKNVKDENVDQRSRKQKVGQRKLVVRIRTCKSALKALWRKAVGDADSWKMVQLIVRLLNWVDHKTQLPASISTHKPRCPTSQRIKNEVLEMVVNSNLRLWRARVWMRLYYKEYRNRCIKLFFWVLLLFYPMLCQRVIGSFYCDEVGDHYYLSLDRSTLCYEGVWLYYLPISITLIVFWVVGVPLLFWVIIYMKRSRGVKDTLLLITDDSLESLKQSLLLKMRFNLVEDGEYISEEDLELFETEHLAHFLRDRNLNDPSTIAQVGFIYHSYNTHFWWFEVWDLGRKLLLNCVISLLAKAGANRIICGLVVLLVYLSVMLFYKPYREPSDSALAGVVHIELFITLFCGLILKMGELYLDERVVLLVTSAAIITNVMTLIYAVFSIFNEKRTGLKRMQRYARDDQRRAFGPCARKLWYKAYEYVRAEIYLNAPDAGPMPFYLVAMELARRKRDQQKMKELDDQLELTSAIRPSSPADRQQDTTLSASQINVLDGEPGAPDSNVPSRKIKRGLRIWTKQNK